MKASSEEIEILPNEISHILDIYKGNRGKCYNLFFNYISIIFQNIFTKKINKLYGTVVALKLSTSSYLLLKAIVRPKM